MPTIDATDNDRFDPAARRFPRGLAHKILLVFAASALGLTAGCENAPSASPVDMPKAREVLKTVLTAWKDGKTPADLQSGSPSITAQDLDWLAGAKLVAYEVLSEGAYDDANLRVPVSLTLQGPDGREAQKRVSYLVGTSPAITVFREL